MLGLTRRLLRPAWIGRASATATATSVTTTAARATQATAAAAAAARVMAARTAHSLAPVAAARAVATVQRRAPLVAAAAAARPAAAAASRAAHTESVRARTTLALDGGRRQYASNSNAVWAHLNGDLTAQRADFTEVPVIDVSSLVTDTPNQAELDKCVSALRDACHRVGFFYVTQHGVSWDLVERTLAQARRFFALPLHRKLEISCKDTPNRGYFEMFGENLGEKKVGDYKEGVDIGRDIPPHERAAATSEHQRRFQLPNRWPSDLPGYRETMDDYYATLNALGFRLSRGIALSLGLDRHFFDDKLDRAMASLRVLHYPPQNRTTVSDEHLGCGPHTDYGVCTILAQDASGLQVRNRSGQWVECPVIPGAFTVNLGDMMQRWTNDVYVSTPHRVLNTTPNQHRYSIPYFYEPNWDAPIHVIDSCTSASRPAKYPPITFGEHLTAMYMKTYAKYSTAAGADGASNGFKPTASA